MTVINKDQRPKVISLGGALYGLDIAAMQNILWPCHAFRISIPQKKRSNLNVFEETILRLTGAGSGDTEKIADIACLEKELVSFIQHRLRELGLVDDHYELSEDGQDLIKEWQKQNQTDGNLEYTVATVFIDLLTGKLLPLVNTGQVTYKTIVRIRDDGVVNFLVNPTDEKYIGARQINTDKNSFWKTVPEIPDIIRAGREFKKKFKRYALLSQNNVQPLRPVFIAEAISIHDNPELVYLHCDMLIQRGNSDILVTDGCGLGFSESFSNYINWTLDKGFSVLNRHKYLCLKL